MPKPITEDSGTAINHPGLKAIMASDKCATERRGRTGGKNEDNAEFWLCLVFQSNNQLQEFLVKIPDVPVLYNAYVDGEVFAKQVGLPVTPYTKKEVGPRVHPIGKKIAMKPNRN